MQRAGQHCGLLTFIAKRKEESKEGKQKRGRKKGREGGSKRGREGGRKFRVNMLPVMSPKMAMFLHIVIGVKNY